MAKYLKEVTGVDSRRQPMYFRYSNEPVARTESHRDGKVNVDLDQNDSVVGIEVVFPDADTFETLFEIIKSRNLSS